MTLKKKIKIRYVKKIQLIKLLINYFKNNINKNIINKKK